jgi:DNA polymerase II small subunit
VTAVENYRNVLLINASAWQAQTEYQRMMDFTPDPAKAVAVNLHTLQPAVMMFS